MTPQQLTDAFAFIERMNRIVFAIRLAESEFAPLVRNPDGTLTGYFDAYHGDHDVPPAHVGRIWGVPVQYDDQVPRGRVVVSGAARHNIHNVMDFDLDLGPPIRIHVEVVDTERQAKLARQLDERLQDMRDHVAFEQHRDFTLEPGNVWGGWTVTCYATGTGCTRRWSFSEEEIAAAGRFDLVDRFGWGAEIEAAKLTPLRERPVAWGKVGLLGGDE